MSDHDGPQGIQGAQGVQGNPGLQGSAGLQGIQGVQGNTDSLALEVGKVIGAIKVIGSEVSTIRGDITVVSKQLADGAVVMSKLDDRLGDVHEQVLVTNGRTTKLEDEVEDLKKKWNAMTLVPRLFVKLVENKAMSATLFAAAVAIAAHIF